MAESGNGQEPYVTLAEAGRISGKHPDAIRALIRRGRLQGRKSNTGHWLVQIPAGWMAESEPGDDVDTPGLHRTITELHQEVAGLRERCGRAESGLDSERTERARERAMLESVVGDLRADRDRLAAELALARKGWLERVLEAVRRR
jgi:hypothetical protein